MRKLLLQMMGLGFCVLVSALAAFYFIAFSHEHQLSGGITFVLCTGLYLWSISTTVNTSHREAQASANQQMAKRQPTILGKELSLN